MWKRLLLLLLACLVSGGLIVSIPLLNIIMRGDSLSRKPTVVRQVSLKKIEMPQEKKKPKEMRRPQRSKPTQTRMQAGPRFAMDLGTAGGTGTSIPMSLTTRGAGGGDNDGEVDERPDLQGRIDPDLPAAIREAEQNAYARFSFCVDEQGNPFNIQVAEERPAGLGMAQTGREALQAARFSPAMSNGRAVSYCGMEWPFEVQFYD